MILQYNRPTFTLLEPCSGPILAQQEAIAEGLQTKSQRSEVRKQRDEEQL